jgi:hypothetical protein
MSTKKNELPTKKNELPTKTSKKPKKSEISKESKVDFELSDEEMADVSGGQANPGSDWLLC